MAVVTDSTTLVLYPAGLFGRWPDLGSAWRGLFGWIGKVLGMGGHDEFAVSLCAGCCTGLGSFGTRHLFAAGSPVGETTYFPYFATGGGWQAVLLVVNDSNEDQTVRVLIGGAAGFETLDGLTLDGEEGEAKFQIALESETIQRFVIGSSSTQLQTGFIVLESSDPITATLFFEARVEGEVRESVGIMPKRDLGNRWLVPIETGSGRDTALAILPEALSIEPSMLYDPNSYLPATIKLTLFKADGAKVGSKNLEVSQIYSRFITEIFDLPARFLGYLEIEGVSQFSTPMVTALFFEWRGGGWELTAIPSLPAR